MHIVPHVSHSSVSKREGWHGGVEQCLVVGMGYHAGRLALVGARPPLEIINPLCGCWQGCCGRAPLFVMVTHFGKLFKV